MCVCVYVEISIWSKLFGVTNKTILFLQKEGERERKAEISIKQRIFIQWNNKLRIFPEIFFRKFFLFQRNFKNIIIIWNVDIFFLQCFGFGFVSNISFSFFCFVFLVPQNSNNRIIIIIDSLSLYIFFFKWKQNYIIKPNQNKARQSKILEESLEFETRFYAWFGIGRPGVPLCQNVFFLQNVIVDLLLLVDYEWMIWWWWWWWWWWCPSDEILDNSLLACLLCLFSFFFLLFLFQFL